MVRGLRLIGCGRLWCGSSLLDDGTGVETNRRRIGVNLVGNVSISRRCLRCRILDIGCVDNRGDPGLAEVTQGAAEDVIFSFIPVRHCLGAHLWRIVRVVDAVSGVLGEDPNATVTVEARRLEGSRTGACGRDQNAKRQNYVAQGTPPRAAGSRIITTFCLQRQLGPPPGSAQPVFGCTSSMMMTTSRSASACLVLN